MSIWDSIQGSIGNAVDTVSEGFQDYVGNEVNNWVNQSDPGRPETVQPEPSPLPYSGPDQGAQQRAAAMSEQLQQWLPWAAVGLAAVAFIAYQGGR